ncbi:MAG: hypothetical protein ACRDL1_00900 [Solirubrobacterales bacterium]
MPGTDGGAAAHLTWNGRYPLETVFHLLTPGADSPPENALTAAVGWGLARSEVFLSAFLTAIGVDPTVSNVAIDLQRYESLSHGRSTITDIELHSPEIGIVVEAKSRWDLPRKEQLERYRQRLDRSDARDRRFVVLTQAGRASFVRRRLASRVGGHAVVPISWGQLALLAARSSRTGNYRNRAFMRELATYLEEVAHIRDPHSNLVYVVALGEQPFGSSNLTTIDFVEQRGLYWFPATGERGYPKYPPMWAPPEY